MDRNISISGKVTYSALSKVDLYFYLNESNPKFIKKLEFETDDHYFDAILLFSDIGIDIPDNYSISFYAKYSDNIETNPLQFSFNYSAFTPILAVSEIKSFDQFRIKIIGTLYYNNIDDSIDLFIDVNNTEYKIKEFRGIDGLKCLNDEYKFENKLTPGQYSAKIIASTQYASTDTLTDFTVEESFQTIYAPKKFGPGIYITENKNFLLCALFKLINLSND